MVKYQSRLWLQNRYEKISHVCCKDEILHERRECACGRILADCGFVKFLNDESKDIIQMMNYHLYKFNIPQYAKVD